jgi:membrane-bound lytic murein transglycosylase B
VLLVVPAPSRPNTVYEQAAARYGVSATVLKALHNVESTAASDGCLANMEGSGALGPFQFKPSTFRAYGVDADGDGRADICGVVDSLFSAARYLQALGADGDPASAGTRHALTRYGTDVAGVVSLATWWDDRAEASSQ